MIQITKENFEKEIIKSKLPVIVDFWAEWCYPCKAIAPVFEEASRDFNGKVTFAKLNVDDNQELSAQFGVMSIPTLILFRNGEEKARIVGSMSSEKLKNFIQKNV